MHDGGRSAGEVVAFVISFCEPTAVLAAYFPYTLAPGADLDTASLAHEEALPSSRQEQAFRVKRSTQFSSICTQPFAQFGQPCPAGTVCAPWTGKGKKPKQASVYS